MQLNYLIGEMDEALAERWYQQLVGCGIDPVAALIAMKGTREDMLRLIKSGEPAVCLIIDKRYVTVGLGVMDTHSGERVPALPGLLVESIAIKLNNLK